MNPEQSKSLVPAPVPDRQQLRAQLRAEEWAMHEKLMAAARTALDHFLSNPHRVTAQDIVKLTELGMELGRSASGLGPRVAEETPARGATLSIEFRAAIEKVYGRPVPPQFIDADEVVTVVPPATPGPPGEGAPGSSVTP